MPRPRRWQPLRIERDIESFHYAFNEALDDQEKIPKATQIVSGRIWTVSGQTKMTAYPLLEQPVPLQPASDAAQVAAAVDGPLTSSGQQGWQLCSPVAFEATWNGGPNAEDIEICLVADAAPQPAFVQSNLGGGVLTFYPGYQFKTDAVP